ncbi:MAG: ATP-binding protein [Bacillota bacterium]
MEELALHILDLATNSIEAGCTWVSIGVDEDIHGDSLTITVEDNGRGMDRDLLSRVTDPFATTRTTRRVGLGVPLLAEAARACDGGITIESERGRGTRVSARFRHGHIDRMPVGDIAATVVAILGGNPGIRLIYRHSVNGRCFALDSDEMKRRLGEVPVSSPMVLTWLEGYLRQNLDEIGGARDEVSGGPREDPQRSAGEAEGPRR